MACRESFSYISDEPKKKKKRARCGGGRFGTIIVLQFPDYHTERERGGGSGTSSFCLASGRGKGGKNRLDREKAGPASFSSLGGVRCRP